MARPLRLHVQGGFYHVTLRGNHRQPIFFADADRDLLESILAETLDKVAARIHAYCWMTNHLHLLIQIADVPLSRFVLRLASRYARAVQASLMTTGHLFERRYHAVLVDADNYLLALIRYIHLNPVRAGLASNPAAYRWSSHRAYLGELRRPWLTTSFALRMFAEETVRATAGYRQFMESSENCHWGVGSLVTHCDNPQVLGSDDFLSLVTKGSWQACAHKSLDDLLCDCCGLFQVTADALTSASRARHLAPARAWIAHSAVTGRVASICEVARFLGRSESAIRQLMQNHPHIRTRQ